MSWHSNPDGCRRPCLSGDGVVSQAGLLRRANQWRHISNLGI